jgi:hypothetical protein
MAVKMPMKQRRRMDASDRTCLALADLEVDVEADLQVAPQFMEQAPGPRGSPQAPHGPALGMRGEAPSLPFVWAANTENRRSSEVA